LFNFNIFQKAIAREIVTQPDFKITEQDFRAFFNSPCWTSLKFLCLVYLNDAMDITFGDNVTERDADIAKGVVKGLSLLYEAEGVLKTKLLDVKEEAGLHKLRERKIKALLKELEIANDSGKQSE